MGLDIAPVERESRLDVVAAIPAAGAQQCLPVLPQDGGHLRVAQPVQRTSSFFPVGLSCAGILEDLPALPRSGSFGGGCPLGRERLQALHDLAAVIECRCQTPDLQSQVEVVGIVAGHGFELFEFLALLFRRHIGAILRPQAVDSSRRASQGLVRFLQGGGDAVGVSLVGVRDLEVALVDPVVPDCRPGMLEEGADLDLRPVLRPQ